jgi:hypothetical protein
MVIDLVSPKNESSVGQMMSLTAHDIIRVDRHRLPEKASCSSDFLSSSSAASLRR